MQRVVAMVAAVAGAVVATPAGAVATPVVAEGECCCVLLVAVCASSRLPGV